ncbi:MAG: hypothetical protein ACKO96_41940, partial [Flammeovirgaceae bacterium]
SAKINDQLTLRLIASYGLMRKDFSFPGDSLKTNRTISTHSSLSSATLYLEKRTPKKFIVQFGIRFNILSTTYYESGVVTSISSLGAKADQQVKLISPPFLLGNSYIDGSSNDVKTWIGLQVNLLYKMGKGL